MFKVNNHNTDLYNTLLSLSRNIFFYEKISLPDTFETRIYLMFMHFSIMMIIFKKKESKLNKKMKELNKILYDILLKIEISNSKTFEVNEKLIQKYFKELIDRKTDKYRHFERYFKRFYDFCFELSLNNMIRDAINFK